MGEKIVIFDRETVLYEYQSFLSSPQNAKIMPVSSVVQIGQAIMEVRGEEHPSLNNYTYKQVHF